MMKIAIFASLVTLSWALPQQQPEVTVLSDTREDNGDGTFRWAFETSDGTRAEQSGYIKNPGAPEDETIQSISGAYSHYTPEGQYISLTYTADENGFVPQGEHLPTPPPIPADIQKALDIIYANAGQQVQRAKKESGRQTPFRGALPRQ